MLSVLADAGNASFSDQAGTGSNAKFSMCESVPNTQPTMEPMTVFHES